MVECCVEAGFLVRRAALDKYAAQARIPGCVSIAPHSREVEIGFFVIQIQLGISDTDEGDAHLYMDYRLCPRVEAYEGPAMRTCAGDRAQVDAISMPGTITCERMIKVGDKVECIGVVSTANFACVKAANLIPAVVDCHTCILIAVDAAACIDEHGRVC